ncbi:MAG: Transposase / integrase [Acidimicrobiales bacterium]|nr:Transposase / integrase [Acidimicrobiales bacterium]
MPSLKSLLLRASASVVFLPVRLVVARHACRAGRNLLKSYEEIMEILEAFALTNSCRAAAELAGCSHHTVEHWVTTRDRGLLPDGVKPPERPS